MDLWIDVTLFPPWVFFLDAFAYFEGDIFILPYLLVSFMHLLITFFELLHDRDRKRWWRCRCFMIEGTWGGLPKLLLGSGRHSFWCISHKETHCREPMWFHEPTCRFFNKSLLASVKGVYMPQKWKVPNSSFKSFMWIKKFIYIQPCTYFHMLHSGEGIRIWFLTARIE